MRYVSRMNTLRLIAASCVVSIAATLAGCGASDSSSSAGSGASAPLPAGHITVDHILIGVKGPGFPPGKRTAEEARKVAYDVLGKVKAGGDWAALKKEFTEDGPPGGPYTMSDNGVRPFGPIPTVFPRGQMAPAFGDVGFKLAVGEIGIADFDAGRSPFGFHIIKRIK
jgi:hypothetical protein